jgi:ATP-binding protein involved in chromosome partitioning
MDELIDESKVLAALRKVLDPDLKTDIVSLGMVKDLKVEGGASKLHPRAYNTRMPLQQGHRADG